MAKHRTCRWQSKTTGKFHKSKRAGDRRICFVPGHRAKRGSSRRRW